MTNWNDFHARRNEKIDSENAEMKKNIKILSREELEVKTADLHVKYLKKVKSNEEISLLFNNHCESHRCTAKKKKASSK
jgi:hypothetical protein